MGVSLDLAGFNGGLYVIYPTHMVNIMGLYKGFKWVELKPRDFIGKSWDCSMIALWQSLVLLQGQVRQLLRGAVSMSTLPHCRFS